MSIIITVLAIIFLAFVLKIVIAQSNNFIFIISKKPTLWIVSMGLLSFIYFFIGSRFNNSIAIIGWSALLAFLVSLPPKEKNDNILNQMIKDKMVDEMYKGMGIKNGRIKYRLGLGAYIIGCVLGWIIFYSQIVVAP